VTVDADTVIKLYESPSDAIYLQADDGQVWDLGTEPADRPGGFAADAAGWLTGRWEPNEQDGHVRTDTTRLQLVATWSRAGGVQYIVRPDEIGGAQRAYLGLADEPEKPDFDDHLPYNPASDRRETGGDEIEFADESEYGED
jgi:hypothetical protein